MDLNKDSFTLIKPLKSGSRITFEDYVNNMTTIEEFVNAFIKYGIQVSGDDSKVIRFRDMNIEGGAPEGSITTLMSKNAINSAITSALVDFDKGIEKIGEFYIDSVQDIADIVAKYDRGDVQQINTVGPDGGSIKKDFSKLTAKIGDLVLFVPNSYTSVLPEEYLVTSTGALMPATGNNAFNAQFISLTNQIVNVARSASINSQDIAINTGDLSSLKQKKVSLTLNQDDTISQDSDLSVFSGELISHQVFKSRVDILDRLITDNNSDIQTLFIRLGLIEEDLTLVEQISDQVLPFPNNGIIDLSTLVDADGNPITLADDDRFEISLRHTARNEGSTGQIIVGNTTGHTFVIPSGGTSDSIKLTLNDTPQAVGSITNGSDDIEDFEIWRVVKKIRIGSTAGLPTNANLASVETKVDDLNTKVVNGNILLQDIKQDGDVSGDTFRKALGLDSNAVAIGIRAGSGSLWKDNIAIGTDAGSGNQGVFAVAIGNGTGSENQGDYAVAIGNYAGRELQSPKSIVINANDTVLNTTSENQILMQAGTTSLEVDTSGLKVNGNTLKGALGLDGVNNLGEKVIDSGVLLKDIKQDGDSTGESLVEALGLRDQNIRLGRDAGNLSQNSWGIAIGQNAGTENQGAASIAIGADSGKTYQGEGSVAIGDEAAKSYQGSYAVAIGADAGNLYQGWNSVAIGRNAGKTEQQTESIAIGYDAGQFNQGQNAIAIGYGAGQISQDSWSILINANDLPLESTSENQILMTAGTASLGVDATGMKVNGVLYSPAKIWKGITSSYKTRDFSNDNGKKIRINNVLTGIIQNGSTSGKFNSTIMTTEDTVRRVVTFIDTALDNNNVKNYFLLKSAGTENLVDISITLVEIEETPNV